MVCRRHTTTFVHAGTWIVTLNLLCGVPADKDIGQNEGKQKKSDPMLNENAGTQKDGRRDTKTNVEKVDKTRIEDQRDTKTKVRGVGKSRSEAKKDTKTKIEESRTQGTACVGLICPGSVWNSGVYEGGADHRIILETMELLKREYEAKSNGCRGGNQT